MKPPGRVKSVPAAAARLGSPTLRVGALMGATLTLAACATVVLGTKEPFQIVSVPAGAHVQLSTGETCITPCRLELPRAVAFRARMSLPGYATQMIPIASRGSLGGAVVLLGNGAVGGIIGASEDLESGAMRSLSPNPLSVRMTPLPLQNSARNH